MSGHKKWEDVKQAYLDAAERDKSWKYAILPVVNDFGGAPVAEHDQCCHVCRVYKAVLDLNSGLFEPCRSCQKEGWRLMRLSKARRFLERHTVGIAMVISLILIAAIIFWQVQL